MRGFLDIIKKKLKMFLKAWTKLSQSQAYLMNSFFRKCSFKQRLLFLCLLHLLKANNCGNLFFFKYLTFLVPMVIGLTKKNSYINVSYNWKKNKHRRMDDRKGKNWSTYAFQKQSTAQKYLFRRNFFSS